MEAELKDECAFCEIADGSAGCRIVAEDAAWIAFFPLKPATPGHTLVIPRLHVSNLWDVDEMQGHNLMTASIRVGRAIRQALRPDGMNLITSSGHAAEQTVFHLHIHIVPRWEDDRFGDIWPPKQSMDEDLQDDVLDDIRSALR